MTDIQLQIMRPERNQENVTYNQEKNRSFESDADLTELIRLPVKGIQRYYIHTLKMRPGRYKKDPNPTSRDEECSQRDNWPIDSGEENISELEEIAMETVKNETQ